MQSGKGEAPKMKDSISSCPIIGASARIRRVECLYWVDTRNSRWQSVPIAIGKVEDSCSPVFTSLPQLQVSSLILP